MSTLNRSRYHEVAAQLREQVRRGELAPGAKMPSFGEMKNRGVSQHTMEKAYSLLEADGLLERSNRSGIYVRRPSAKRTIHALGVLTGVSGKRSPYWAQLLEGVQDAAHAAGVEVALLNPRLSAIRWQRVDGLLTIEADLFDETRIPALMPRVSLVNVSSAGASVVADEAGGVHQATNHLLQLRHTRIARLVSYVGVSNAAREAAFGETMRTAGLKPRATWTRELPYPLPDDSFRVAGYDAMKAWLRNGWRQSGCTALMCQNDETALGAMAALREANIAIPDEVSVVGFDGTELCDFARPTLFSVTVPLHEVGAAGVRLLLRQLKTGNIANQTVVLPTHLKPGGSIRPLQN